MTLKIYHFILFLWFFTGHGQITNNGSDLTPAREINSKKLILKKKKKIEYINQNSEIEVYLKQSDITIKGKFMITSDSTIEIKHKTIHLAFIEKIKIRANTRTEGIVFSCLSAGLTAGSIYFFYRASQSSDFWSLIGNGIIGTLSGAMGTFTLPPAIVLASNSTYDYYDSNKWSISITE